MHKRAFHLAERRVDWHFHGAGCLDPAYRIPVGAGELHNRIADGAVGGVIDTREACIALNLSVQRTYSKIIIPQAIPVVIPGFGNYLVSIFKDTPMLSVIGVMELFQVATSIGAETYRFLEPYTLVGLIFLGLSLPAAMFMRQFEDFIRASLGMKKLYSKD